MTFSVDTVDARAFVARLAELSDQARAAATYLSTHCQDTGAGTGIFVHVDNAIREASAELVPNYERMATLTGAAATELGWAVDWYERLDFSAAADLDATYVDPSSPAAGAP